MALCASLCEVTDVDLIGKTARETAKLSIRTNAESFSPGVKDPSALSVGQSVLIGLGVVAGVAAAGQLLTAEDSVNRWAAIDMLNSAAGPVLAVRDSANSIAYGALGVWVQGSLPYAEESLGYVVIEVGANEWLEVSAVSAGVINGPDGTWPPTLSYVTKGRC